MIELNHKEINSNTDPHIKKCKKCGGVEFFKDRHCKACKKKYDTEHRKANRKRINETNNRWCKAHPEQAKARNKKYRQSHPEAMSIMRKRWVKKNKEKLKIAQKLYQRNHLKESSERSNKWNKAHLKERSVIDHNRRARIKNVGGTFTKENINSLLKQQKQKCVVCKADISKSYHIDHIMPLALGGSNNIFNIQLLCPTCNLRKGAKHPIEFMQSVGYLL